MKKNIILCPECNSEFSTKDKIASLFRAFGRIKCKHCESEFTQVIGRHRIKMGIFCGVLVFSTSMINMTNISSIIENIWIRAVLAGISVGVIVLIVEYITMRYAKYEKE